MRVARAGTQTNSRKLTQAYTTCVYTVWSLSKNAVTSSTPFSAFEFGKPSVQIPHDCQTGRWLSILRAQWSQNIDYYPHFTVGSMKRSLDVFASTGECVARLFDPDVSVQMTSYARLGVSMLTLDSLSCSLNRITAVPAVTASHPSIVNQVVGGNGSGKVSLWGRPE